MTSPKIEQDVEPKCCDVCGGRQHEVICRQDRRGKPLNTEVCVRCGLVAHQRIPTDEELRAFYGQSYRQQYKGESTPSEYRVMRAWKNAMRIHRQIGSCLRGDERVVEVGAGIGCTVRHFAELGFDSTGIEPHRGYCAFGQQRLGASLRNTELFDADLDVRADLVLLIHVIEHFNSPTRALRRIREFLSPDGRLYVECPNLNAPFAPRRKMFHYAHIHNFTPWTLAMTARHCGFELVSFFGSEESDNLRALFQMQPADTSVDPYSYDLTMEAIQRHSIRSYYCRWEYLTQRAATLGKRAYERVVAKRYMSDLMERLASPSQGRTSRSRSSRPQPLTRHPIRRSQHASRTPHLDLSLERHR